MKTSTVKQHFEAVKTYISAMHMRVDDDNVVKARNLIAFLNARIAECDAEMAGETAQESKENIQ